MPKSGELAGLVARLAIAALAGPHAFLSEAAKYGQSRYEEGEQPRQIHRQVTQAVEAWAANEQFTLQDIELGLQLAADAVARFGLSNDEMAAMAFDPVQAAHAVVAAAKSADPYWGTEGHYAAAVRGIGVTYEALIAQLRASESVVIPAFLALQNNLDAHAKRAGDRVDIVAGDVSNLAEYLSGRAAVEEVMSYLRIRISDWDLFGWRPGRQSSALERHLMVRDQESGQSLSAAEALEGAQLLVVLGGPGSGKTWLGRRFARQVAMEALSKLEGGARLDEVELPLLTTWSEWTKTVGDTTQSLVASSFASGLGHSSIPEREAVARLQRTFGSDAQILLVVDSLDEAADVVAQGTRMHELGNLPTSWRVVVTSRPAAWNAAYRGGAGRAKPRVVDLSDLAYPEDVEAFVRDWFDSPARRAQGEALIQDIRGRDDVARVAVVPLMLTFYCLLAEQTTAVPLPAQRRELYRRLTRLLLRGAWADSRLGPDRAPNLDHCEELLVAWAWSAVRSGSDEAGLGVWNDRFTQPAKPKPLGQAEWRAIDHIAPKVTEDDEGNVTRRFIHRTFLEHFVAEHIAALEASEAAELLLPHIWFDPDWQFTAPAAIIAHNQRHQGALLQRLLSRALHPLQDPARQFARNELDRLLLTLAQESEPGEWPQDVQDLIHQCRVEKVTRLPGLVRRSAHWTDSNPGLRVTVLQSLAAAKDPRFVGIHSPRALAALAGVLLAISSDTEDRAEARTNVIKALQWPEPIKIDDGVLALAHVLLMMAPSDEDRADARAAVLQALQSNATNDAPWVSDALALALLTLTPTAEERDKARPEVLRALAVSENADHVRALAEALSTLTPSAYEQDNARSEVLRVLSVTENPWLVRCLAQVLTALAPEPEERSKARAQVLRALATVTHDDPWLLDAQLALVLLVLAPTDDERHEARPVVQQALAATDDPWRAAALALALALQPLAVRANPWRQEALGLLELHPLEPAEDEKAEARARVLLALATLAAEGASWQIYTLAEVLVQLEPSAKERAEARAAVLHTMSTDPRQPAVVDALVTLAPSTDEQSETRTRVLEALLASDNQFAVRDLAEALSALTPSPEERAEDRGEVLKALVAAEDPRRVRILAEALLALAPSAHERYKARPAVLKALAAAEDPWLVHFLSGVLLALYPSAEEQYKARPAVLKALAAAEYPWLVAFLTETLLAPAASADQRYKARQVVLKTLAAAEDPLLVVKLAEVLLTLTPASDEKDMAHLALQRASNAHSFGAEKAVKVLRSFSSVDSWLEWLTASP